MEPASLFEERTLGRSGLVVSPIGIAASYGVSTAAVEFAFDHGINYFYWGSIRTSSFGQAIRNLKRFRERMVIVLQSYSRLGFLTEWSVERGLKKLGLDYVDVLLLGWWNRPVTAGVWEVTERLVRRGLVRRIGLSSHHRPLFVKLAEDSRYDVFHIRYNAAHRGAEQDVFAKLEVPRPGIVAYTATSWAQLMNSRRIPENVPRPSAGDCYRFVLSNPHVDLCMTGPSNDNHVRHAIEALTKGPMDEAEMAWMRVVGDAVYGKPRTTAK